MEEFVSSQGADSQNGSRLGELLRTEKLQYSGRATISESYSAPMKVIGAMQPDSASVSVSAVFIRRIHGTDAR